MTAPRVLVIDDEPDVVRLILKVLSGRGHVVQVARDGATALQRVKLEAPDVILLDSDLPKIDGAEVCRRLKTDTSTQKIPVVNSIADKILVNQINDLLVDYGHAEYTTDPAKYKEAKTSQQPAH